jgi:predicted RecA/RadA family phage recombinase
MQNYLGEGDEVVITAPAAVASGQPLLVGALFGICLFAAAQGQPVRLKLGAKWQLAKPATEVWAIGSAIFWDNVNLVATLTNTGVRIGVAIAAAANPSIVGNARLNGTF